jgi:hypothetical protein
MYVLVHLVGPQIEHICIQVHHAFAYRFNGAGYRTYGHECEGNFTICFVLIIIIIIIIITVIIIILMLTMGSGVV